jgi:hypothetical protein
MTSPSTSTGARLRIDEVGHALLVRVVGAHGPCAAVAAELPAESGRISVVLPNAELARRPDLAQRLRQWVPGRYDSVRLVAAGAALEVDGYGPAPARVLCELLDADVVAPDGDLVATPGGSLFVASTRDTPAKGWWRFRPGRPPEAGGRRFPTPRWERGLSASAHVRTDLSVEEIPAGLWVRWPGLPSDPDDLAYAIPVHPDSAALLVSRAGDRPLPSASLGRLVEAMPEQLREQLVVIPYGDQPVADGALGAVVSLAAARTLRVQTGLPLHLSGLGTRIVVVDADAEPAWRPFAREFAWRPQGSARVRAWTPPAEQLLAAGPGQFMLNERWMLEVLEAGLWIREIDRADGPPLPRQLPLDAEHCTVVIGACDERPGNPPWRLIMRLLANLPADARERLQIAVPAAAGERFAVTTAQVVRRVVPLAPIVLLTRAGQLTAWRDGAGRPASARPDPAELKRGRTAVDADDTTRLLNFMDEIRRMPAWDELPSQRGEMPAAPPPARVPAAPRGPAPAPERQAEPVPYRGTDSGGNNAPRHAVIGRPPTTEDSLEPAPSESRRLGTGQSAQG